MAVQVHDGEDQNLVGFDTIEDAVGEAVDNATADVAFQDGPGVRVSGDILRGGEDFQGEFFPQSGVAVFIVGDGRKEFRFGLGVKREGHRAKRSRIREKT